MKKLLMMLLFPYALIKVPDSLFCTRGRCKDLPHCFVAWTTYLFTISIIQKTIVAIAFIFLLANCVKAQNSKEQLLVVTIEMNDTAQTIQNIGASGCWYSEAIGSDWPAEKKERIAELLFSRAKDKNDNPMGIGLSAWRFNIGGGTQEQGDASGIKDPNHRVECFLNPDGSYDWNKQPGYRWFLKKAKQYGVENLVAFSNTPPVQFTQNGLGYKTAKDYTANLLPGKYRAYTDFLATVIKHFDKEGLHFSYISPVNEPQWDWAGKPGEAKQEGSPWTNEEISRVVKSLDSSLQKNQVPTKILTTEAGMLTFLYGNTTPTSRQIQELFSGNGKLNISTLKSVPKVIAAHSYFTDLGDSSIINVRKNVSDTAKKYGVNFWQSEYCMLGNGYKDGIEEKRTPMDCALFLAKIIHNDLAVANAAAWHFWNAYEPGSADVDTRYYLIALKPDPGFVNGTFTPTKNLWALGHYSLFIRPGMQRLHISRSDNLSDIEAAQKTMISAYKDDKGKLVIVAINYAQTKQSLVLKLQHAMKIKEVQGYLTTAATQDNMKAYTIKNIHDNIVLPPRSITTIVTK
jgi:O-glycosyl hydrolase